MRVSACAVIWAGIHMPPGFSKVDGLTWAVVPPGPVAPAGVVVALEPSVPPPSPAPKPVPVCTGPPALAFVVESGTRDGTSSAISTSSTDRTASGP